MTQNHNSGLIVGGNLVAGAVAVNGNATNSGAVNADLRQLVAEVQRAVDATSAPAAVKGEAAAALEEASQAAAADDKPRAASRLAKMVEILKLGGATIGELVALSTPLGALAKIVGASLGSLGF